MPEGSMTENREPASSNTVGNTNDPVRALAIAVFVLFVVGYFSVGWFLDETGHWATKCRQAALKSCLVRPSKKSAPLLNMLAQPVSGMGQKPLQGNTPSRP
jgi:hypothetical protein